jgi:hypothetical protein
VYFGTFFGGSPDEDYALSIIFGGKLGESGERSGRAVD